MELEDAMRGHDAADVPVIAACDAETGRILALCLQNHEDEEGFREAYRVCSFKTMTIAEACDQIGSEPRCS
jgi:hypothetical protein